MYEQRGAYIVLNILKSNYLYLRLTDTDTQVCTINSQLFDLIFFAFVHNV